MSAGSDSILVRLADESGVGEARRAARSAARELGFGPVETEQAAIVAAEASRNAVVHGRDGVLLLTTSADGAALDLLALDRGPGIADVRRALEDGYSTRRTAGQGLGAIARLATVFDVYSAPEKGTALFARMGGAAPAGARLEVGAVCVAVDSEPECGDAWAVEHGAGRLAVLLADGLGHGPMAAGASRAAVASFRKSAGLSAPLLVERLHAALRPTRGAAIAVAEETVGARMHYAGIGNISGVLAGSPQVRKMVSLPGTAGHHARTIRGFVYDWPLDALLVMHSDGLTGRWDLADYPGLAQRHPALVAGVLYRDFSRGRDDATVVVVRRAAS